MLEDAGKPKIRGARRSDTGADRSHIGPPRVTAGNLVVGRGLRLEAVKRLRLAVTGFGVAIVVITLPGMWLLPRPGRTSVDGVTTVNDAEAAARASGLHGWELVAFVQHLAARKFTYSRRNPWDTPARAFERGMGYCQQQALALNQIYGDLGIDSRPVFAMRCWFPAAVVHGRREAAGVGGHSWLRVRLEDQERDICCGDEGNTPGHVNFRVLSPVHDLWPALQPFMHVGAAIENVRRDAAAWWRTRKGTRGQAVADAPSE